MAEQLALLPAGAGRPELWFRAVDLLSRPVADIPDHECEGGWGEAEKWCYLTVLRIDREIRFAWALKAELAEYDGYLRGDVYLRRRRGDSLRGLLRRIHRSRLRQGGSRPCR